VLDRLSDRWTVLVLLILDDAGTIRFTALRSKIPDVSQRMLAQTLRRIKQDGLVARTVYPTIPPRVEYTLTTVTIPASGAAKMDAIKTRQVKVFVHALLTDQVLSGWDENGGQYSTVVLGHRTFSKVIDLPRDPSETAAVNLNINGRSYAATTEPAWSDADQQWRLETTLPGEDNQPLNDCTNDASWTEIKVQATAATVSEGQPG